MRGARFTDSNGSIGNDGVVQGPRRAARRRLILHFHERKTERTPAIALGRDVNGSDFAVWCKGGAKIFFPRAERKVAYI